MMSLCHPAHPLPQDFELETLAELAAVDAAQGQLQHGHAPEAELRSDSYSSGVLVPALPTA